ncbi:MAG TPA: hypothetical protein VNT51_07465 [Miltoncostaeaceae bacterium]|nr:hypothetical protein [Miltoncostaeaceae bacterium]
MSETFEPSPQRRRGGTAERGPAGSCRMCPVSCDRVVYPSGCVEAGCTRLYTYDTDDGRRVMGCMEKVYRVEIDVEAFQALQRTRAGFGALRVWREPLAVCRCAVEPTFVHRPHGACVNPAFRESAPDLV